jgi:rRNA maturation endonuclease Nob1
MGLLSWLFKVFGSSSGQESALIIYEKENTRLWSMIEILQEQLKLKEAEIRQKEVEIKEKDRKIEELYTKIYQPPLPKSPIEEVMLKLNESEKTIYTALENKDYISYCELAKILNLNINMLRTKISRMKQKGVPFKEIQRGKEKLISI